MPRAKTKEDRLKDIMHDLLTAEKILDSELAPKWVKMREQYLGEYLLVQDVYGHEFSVNVVQALTSLIIPSVYFQDPRVLCNPTREQDVRACKITESIVNYWIRELKLKRQMERCTLDAFLFGEGVIKLGYSPDIDTVLTPITDNIGNPLSTDAQEPLMEDNSGNVFVEREGRFIQVMDSDGEIPPISQEVIDVNEFIRRGQPFAIRWEPWNFLKDPEAKYSDCSDADWIAFRTVLPLKQVKNNPAYKNTGNLMGTRISPSVMNNPDRLFPLLRRTVNEDEDRVELFEVWKKEWNNSRKRWDIWQYAVVKGHDKFLLEQKSPYLAEGFPVEVLTFLDDPGSSHSPSPIEAVQPQINTINLARTQFANFRERFVPKYLANSILIDETDARNVIQGDDALAMVTVDEGTDLGTVMRGLDIPELNPAILDDIQLSWEEIRRITGITEDMLGGAGAGRQATQASFIQGAANVRLQHKQDRIGDSVMEIGRFFKQVLQQFGEYQMAVRIEGTVTEEEWAVITVAEAIPDDIAFDIDVFPSSFQSKEAMLQSAMSMYNLLRQDPLVNPERLIKKVLKAFGEPSPEAFLVPPQPPQIDPATGEQIDPNQHGGSARAGAIDQNELRQPSVGEPGETGRALSGDNA